MVSNLGAILAQQPAVNVTKAEGLCGDGFSDLCEKAAEKAAKELEKAINKAKAKARRDAKKRNKERKKKLRNERRKAQKEARRRAKERKQSKNAARRARIEEELRKKGPNLGKDGKALEKRGKKLAEKEKDLNEKERRLRREEGEARKNDRNCRGTACQNARSARAENSRQITEHARQTGRLQSDMARYTGQMQDFQRKANRLERMNDAGLGMTKAQFRSHMADKRLARAHKDVNTINERLRALDEKRDKIGRRGGSGSRQWKEVQREMDALNKALPKARSFAQGRASQDAVKAKAYAMGLGKEHRAYERAQRGTQAVKDRNSIAQRLKNQAKTIADAKKSGASASELRKLKNFEKQLWRDLKTANRDVEGFSRAAARGIRNTSRLSGKKLDAKYNSDQRKFVGAFNEKRSLRNMTDRELAERDAIFEAAEKRIDQATRGIGKDIPRAKSGAFKKREALTDRKLDAQEKLTAMDEEMNNAFLRGPVFANAGRAYQEARNEVLEEIDGLDREISKFSPLEFAEAVVRESEGVTKHLNSLTDGFPKNSKGRIDTGKLAKQVVVVGRAQMELSRIAGEMKNLEDKAAGGKKLTTKETARLKALKSTAGKMSAELKKAGLDVKVQDGKLSVNADSLIGSVTWNASREAITENIAKINKTRLRLAELRRQQKPKDLLPSPPAVESDITRGVKKVDGVAVVAASDAGQNAAKKPIGRTRVRTTSKKPAPKVAYKPGGLFGDLIDKVNKASAAAVLAGRRAAENAIWNQKKAVTPAQLAKLREKAANERKKAQETRKQVLRKRAEAKKAAAARNEAAARAKEKRRALETLGANRIRLARDYKKLADGNYKSAEEAKLKAEKNDASGARLRDRADQLDRYADRIEATDKRLAARAREAAINAREDAKTYDKYAESHRRDEKSDRGFADRFTKRKQGHLNDAKEMFDDYNSAVDNFRQKAAATDQKIGEFRKLANDYELSSKAANTSARELALSQNWNFNQVIGNPPSGKFYSGKSSSERVDWLQKNIPNWNGLSIKQKENYLKQIDLAEATRQYRDAEREYHSYTANTDLSRADLERRLDRRDAKFKEAQAIKEKRTGSEADKKKIAQLEQEANSYLEAINTTRKVGLQKRVALRKAKLKQIEKIKSQWTSSDADQRKIAKLESEANVILDRIKLERKKHQVIGEEFLKKRQRLNRLTWAANTKAREAEILRRVDFVAQAKGELELATHAATARKDAFTARLGKIKNSEERKRLNDVHLGFAKQDQARINTLRHTYKNRLSQITLDSAFDNLNAIGQEKKLAKAVDARLKQSGVVQGRLAGQTKLAKQLAEAVDVKGEKFNPFRSLVKAYDVVNVVRATVVGGGVGAIKGTGKALIGLGKLVLWEPIDTLGERGEQLMAKILPKGFRTNVFGTDNQEFADKLVADPGGTGFKMLMGMGKQSFDAWQNLKKLKVAAEAGEAQHAFDASLGVSEFLAENLVDPTIVLGGAGRVLKGLSYIGKVDDVLRGAAKGLDNLGAVDGAASTAFRTVDQLDLTRLGQSVTKVIGAEKLVALGRLTARGDDLLKAASNGLGEFGSAATRRLLGEGRVDKLSKFTEKALDIGSMSGTDVAKVIEKKAGVKLVVRRKKPVVPDVAVPNFLPGQLVRIPGGTKSPLIGGVGRIPGAKTNGGPKLAAPGNIAVPPKMPDIPANLGGAPGRAAAVAPPGGGVRGLVQPPSFSRAVNDTKAPLMVSSPGARAPTGTIKLPPPDLPPAVSVGTKSAAASITPPPARAPPAGAATTSVAGNAPVAGSSFGASPGGPSTPRAFGASPGGFGMSPGGAAGKSPLGRSPAKSPSGTPALREPVAAPANMKTVDVATFSNELGVGGIRVTPPGASKPILMRHTELLGEGSSSKAFAIPGTKKGDDLGQAAKFTRRGDGSFKYDDVGRGVVKKIEKTSPGLVQTPTLHQRYRIGKHEKLTNPLKGDKEFSGGFVSVMDRTPPTANKMARAKRGDPNPSVSHLDADGRLSSAQTGAFNRGADAINGQGFAWVDNHTGNFAFNKSTAPGSKGAVLVVTDPGGIIPMKATRTSTGQVKTAAQNARDLQAAIHNPPAHIRDAYRGVAGQVEHQKWLAKHFDDAVDWDSLRKSVGSDVRSLGRPDVPDGNVLSFNPRVSIDHPELFAFSPPKPAIAAPSGTTNLGKLDMPAPLGTAKLGAPDLPPPGTTRLPPPDLPGVLRADNPAGNRPPATGPPKDVAAGAPAHSRTGVQEQLHCENCALVAAEAILKDAGIVAGERSQAAMRQFALDRNLLKEKLGMDIHQVETYLHMNGVRPENMRSAVRTPEEMGLGLQRGEDLMVVIQNGKNGYHWVRVEGFARDAAGRPFVSFGEGSLPAGMSKRMTVSEFQNITRAYPDTPGGPPGSTLQSLSINRNTITVQERQLARGIAADNAALGAEGIARARHGTTRLPPLELPGAIAAGSPGGLRGKTPSPFNAVDNAVQVPRVAPEPSAVRLTSTEAGDFKLSWEGNVTLDLPRKSRLGKGSTSTAMEIPPGASKKAPGEPGQVAKLTAEGHAALDDLGRGVVEIIDNRSLIQTPKLHRRFNIGKVGDASSARKFEHGTVSVVDKSPHPSFDKLPADMKGPNGAMTPGQVDAFNAGLSALNKKGYAWLDNKPDNFTFKRIGDGAVDRWVLVVIDTGGMVPMIARGGRTAAQNAASLQIALAKPSSSAQRLGNTSGSHAIHKVELAQQFDDVVDWNRLKEVTGTDYRTLGHVPAEVAADLGKGFLYNPRNAFDHPEVAKAFDKPPSQPSTGSASAPLPDGGGSGSASARPAPAVTAKTAIEVPPSNGGNLPATALENPPGAASLPKTAIENAPVIANVPKTIKAPPHGKVKIKREDGSEVTLNFGEELGAGSTSTAYRNQADKDALALRVTRAPETAGKSPSTLAQQQDIATRAEKLDDFGRLELGSMADKNGVIHLADGTQVRIPRVIERIKLDGKGTGPLKGATVVEIVELAPASFNKIVAKTGKGMTRGQAIAFDKAHRHLNDNGLVWLDNHAGNFGFRHIEGDKWEFWIIDPGGIVPVSAVGNKSVGAVARDLQKIINHPPKKLVDRFLSAGSQNARTRIAIGMMKTIIVKHGDSIDVARIGLAGPEKLIFNPSGVLPFRRAHELFGHDLVKMDSTYRTYAKVNNKSAAPDVPEAAAISRTAPWAPPPTATAAWAPEIGP